MAAAPGTPFEIAIVALGLLAAGLGFALRRRARPPVGPEAPPWPMAGAVFCAAGVFLLVRHHLADPSWTPRGADWDSWYQSALAVRHDLSAYPPTRWPLYGALGALLDLALPGPLFRDLQVLGLLASASATAAVFLAGERLLCRWAGLAAAGLALAFPLDLHHAGWTSGYPLWAAAVAWAVAGLAAALRSGRAGAWALTGAAVAGVLAAEPKGLAAGGALLAAALPAAQLRRPRARPAAALLAPVLALGLLYAAFPPRLASLDALAAYARRAEVDPAADRADPGIDPYDGYVFGQSSGPLTIARTLAGVGAADPGQATHRLAPNLRALGEVVGGLTPLLCAWLVLGGLSGALGALFDPCRRRLLLAWLGLLAAAAALLSALALHLNTRFLLPFFWLAPLLFVAPIALPLRGTRAGILTLLAFGVAALPGSPWRAPAGFRDPVEVRAPAHAVRLYHDLRATPGLGEVALCMSPFTTWFALDATAGRTVAGVPDDRFHRPMRPPDPREQLLVETEVLPDGRAGGLACPPGDRPLLGAWPSTGGEVRWYGALPHAEP